MRCDYQTDVGRRLVGQNNNIKYPAWWPRQDIPKLQKNCQKCMQAFFDLLGLDMEPLADQKYLVDLFYGFLGQFWRLKSSRKRRWQYDFLRQWHTHSAGGKSLGHLHYVEECVVKVMLIPNVLDIDILWALAITPQRADDIFTRLPVHAIINGMWRGLCHTTWVADSLLGYVDLVAVIVVSVSGTASLEHSSQGALKLSLAVLSATVIKDFLLLSCCLCNFVAHLRGKVNKQERALRSETNRVAVKSYSAMWTMKNLFTHTFFLVDVVQLVLLVCLVFLPTSVSKTPTMKCVYVLNLIMRTLAVIRLSCNADGSGSRVIAVLKTATSSSVLQMMEISFIFMAICYFSIFSMLNKTDAWGNVLVEMYRILFFADGDQLDDVGLTAICDGEVCPTSHPGEFMRSAAKAGLMMVFTFFFNIMILNLLIAVFGTAYDQSYLDAPKHFMKMKSVFSCKYYFTFSHLKHKELGWFIFVWPPLLVVGLWMGVSMQKNHASVLALTLGDVLLLIWTRQGNVVDLKDNETKFLWYFHPIDASESYDDSQDAIEKDLEGVATKKDLDGIEREVNEYVRSLNYGLQELESEVRCMTTKLSKIVT